MTMRNPAMAVLWESWRLSRPHLARSLFLAVFGGAVLIVSPIDSGASAMWMLMLAGFLAWTGFGWAVNVDSRKGFSMALGFARPIPTWMLVSVPMAYVGITCAVTYLVYVLVLQAALDISFPLLPVAALVGTLSLATVAFYWWRPNAAFRWAFVVGLLLLWLYFVGQTAPYAGAMPPDRWPDLFAYSAWAYVWMALTSAAAVAVTIASVARQRRGDDGLTLTMPARRSADAPPRTTFRTWIADRLRVTCPTSSPTRAQLWFDVYTVGGRVLATGLLTALAAPVALTILVDAAGFTVTGEMLAFWALYAFLPPLVVGLRSLLGVRRKQGVSYLSAFTSTRAMGTGRLIGLKVLVTSLALLGASSAIGISLWFFAIQLGVWGPEVADSEYVSDFLGLFEWPPIIALVLVWAVAVVAAGGAIHALFLLNAKRLLLTGLGLTIYITSLVVVPFRGWVGEVGLALVLPAAIFLTTIFLFRRALAERIVTPRGFGGVVMLCVAFALAHRWFGDVTEWGDIVWLVFPALIPLWILALTVWSFSRLRHR